MPDFLLQNQSTLRVKLNGAVTGVGANKNAVITLPIGPTYEKVFVKCTIAGTAATRAELESMLGDIRLQLSQMTLFTLSALQLIAREEFYNVGIVGDTGYICISFNRDWMRQVQAARLPALGTLGESAFTLTIAQGGSSTIDLMEPMAWIRPGAEEVGGYVRIDRYTPALPAVGVNDINVIKPKPGEFLYALGFETTVAANLTKATIIADGTHVFDEITQADLLRSYVNPIAPRTQQTSKKVLWFDFTALGWDNPLPMTMDTLTLRLTYASAAPTNFAILAEIGATQAPRIRQ